jgi:hypothetical protein
MGTAVKRALRLDPVTHDLAATVLTHRSQAVNGAFKAVEGMGVTGRYYLKGEVVVIAADFTSSHRALLDRAAPCCPPPKSVFEGD